MTSSDPHQTAAASGGEAPAIAATLTPRQLQITGHGFRPGVRWTETATITW